jgi:hypothetical protein
MKMAYYLGALPAAEGRARTIGEVPYYRLSKAKGLI